jgi:hypothetical protein
MNCREAAELIVIGPVEIGEIAEAKLKLPWTRVVFRAAYLRDFTWTETVTGEPPPGVLLASVWSLSF